MTFKLNVLIEDCWKNCYYWKYSICTLSDRLKWYWNNIVINQKWQIYVWVVARKQKLGIKWKDMIHVKIVTCLSWLLQDQTNTITVYALLYAATFVWNIFSYYLCFSKYSWYPQINRIYTRVYVYIFSIKSCISRFSRFFPQEKEWEINQESFS